MFLSPSLSLTLNEGGSFLKKSELLGVEILSPLVVFQVMETKDMLYIVTEFAKNGEMFGELHSF